MLSLANLCFAQISMYFPLTKLQSLPGITFGNLWTLAGVDLDGFCLGSSVDIFIFFLLSWLVASIVNGMVRSAGALTVLLGDLVKYARLGFLFRWVVGHAGTGQGRACDWK